MPHLLPARQFISIHAPLTGSDLCASDIYIPPFYFNPRSPHRERLLLDKKYNVLENFNPRSPHRERRLDTDQCYKSNLFQSTLPSQGATHLNSKCGNVSRISIHAPLTGSDIDFAHCTSFSKISIHAPLTGSDRIYLMTKTKKQEFQSTLPSQGATLISHTVHHLAKFQSTLPSQGATRCFTRNSIWIIISIHAPLTGSDHGSDN